MPSIVVHFEYEKKTKNEIVRFMETGDKATWKMGRIYVNPDALAEIGFPKTLTVTITKGK